MFKSNLSFNFERKKENNNGFLSRFIKFIIKLISFSFVLFFVSCIGDGGSSSTPQTTNEAPSINTTFSNISIDDNTTRKININIDDVDGDCLTLNIHSNDANITITPNFTNPILQANYTNQTLDFNITSAYNISKIVKITLTLSDTVLVTTKSFDVNITNTVAQIFKNGDTWKGKVYNTVTSPYTSKVWLDRNLGASQVCTAFNDSACYGGYFQWGRSFDGHQESNSTTTSTLSTDINATIANGKFIINSSSPEDWVDNGIDDNGSIRSANWSKIDGSSACPVGFRVPTKTELKAETIDQNISNGADAYSNFLKLPSDGYRDDGFSLQVGAWGSVWSSSINGNYFIALEFGGSVYLENSRRDYGRSVRCLRD